jgi:hypothetical protein
MKIIVPEDVSGTCIVDGERADFQVKAGRHTSKNQADIDVFQHLVDAGLATDPDAPVVVDPRDIEPETETIAAAPVADEKE